MAQKAAGSNPVAHPFYMSRTYNRACIKEKGCDMRALVTVMACVFMLTASGCAKRSESEQLKYDMDKAAKQMNKDMKNMVN